jgi:hypothetical protein
VLTIFGGLAMLIIDLEKHSVHGWFKRANYLSANTLSNTRPNLHVVLPVGSR